MVVALPWSETISSTIDSSQGRLTFVEIPIDTAEDSLTNWCRYDGE